MVLNRSRRKAPNLTTWDRFFFGLSCFLLAPARICKNAVVVRTSTLFRFHKALKKRKYRRLFSSHQSRKPGPKGPSQELVTAIVEMKRRNPRFGCPRIAQQISRAFDLEIDKDIIRRVLAKYYHPRSSGGGPSWLTLFGQARDSLWSVDLFRCESALRRTHSVLLVMDQFTRRIVGFGIHAGDIDGAALCRMFNQATDRCGQPKSISSDNDPLFSYNLWKANLRVLDIQEVKTVPYAPVFHPFVERLIGTIRREYPQGVDGHEEVRHFGHEVGHQFSCQLHRRRSFGPKRSSDAFRDRTLQDLRVSVHCHCRSGGWYHRRLKPMLPSGSVSRHCRHDHHHQYS